MRRRTRKHVVHLCLFSGILFLILYITHPQAKTKAFAWNTIRYQTTSATLPESRGICPGLASTSKPALVVSRVAADGDSSWLDAVADLYHLCVYTADAPLDTDSTYLQVPATRGHEAMAYLTFLIDNYATMPVAGAVFVHGTRWAWHNDAPDYDNVALLTALNVSAALAPWGYHNMRCDWSVGTCPPSTPPQGGLDMSVNAVLQPWSARTVSDAAMPRALAALFGRGGRGDGDDDDDNEHLSSRGREAVSLGRSDTIRAQCCAQFVVARERVWQHSRAEYVALRQWLLDGGSLESNNAAPRDDRISGRILSYVWHILFLQQGGASNVVDLEQLNAQACPSAAECYCRLYGRCNLKGCTYPDSCYGQYEVPPNFKLPADWAKTHS